VENMTRDNGFYQGGRTFMGCPGEIDNTHDFAIIGIPYDGASSQQRGVTADAPHMIRYISNELSYASEEGRSLNDVKFGDMGNITKDLSQSESDDIKPEELHEKIVSEYHEMYAKNNAIIPVTLGGNHYITYPVFKYILQHYQEELFFILFDAHLDFYDKWEDSPETHCTITKRIFDLEDMGVNHIVVLCARDIDIPEQRNAQKEGLKYVTMKAFSDSGLTFLEYIKKFVDSEMLIDTMPETKQSKAYISIDIDALDPSAAPATGYPIPGGISYRQLYHGLEYLSKRVDIIGFDVVEYAPNLDTPGQITGFLCAKIISELMMMIKKTC